MCGAPADNRLAGRAQLPVRALAAGEPVVRFPRHLGAGLVRPEHRESAVGADLNRVSAGGVRCDHSRPGRGRRGVEYRAGSVAGSAARCGIRPDASGEPNSSTGLARPRGGPRQGRGQLWGCRVTLHAAHWRSGTPGSPGNVRVVVGEVAVGEPRPSRLMFPPSSGWTLAWKDYRMSGWTHEPASANAVLEGGEDGRS